MHPRGKITTITLSMLVSLLALSACSDAGDATGGTSGEAVSVTSAAPAPAPDAAASTTAAADPEASFLKTVRTMPAAEGKDDEELLKVGRQVCEELDGGKTIEDLALAAQKIEEPAERELGAAQIAVAIPTLCPQHLPELARFAEEQKEAQSG